MVLSAKCYWSLECLEPEIFRRKDAVRRRKCRSWTINPSALIISSFQLNRPKFRNLRTNIRTSIFPIIMRSHWKYYSSSSNSFRLQLTNLLWKWQTNDSFTLLLWGSCCLRSNDTRSNAVVVSFSIFYAFLAPARISASTFFRNCTTECQYIQSRKLFSAFFFAAAFSLYGT